MIAEADFASVVLAEQRLHAFQDCDGERAAHAAAVEGEKPLGSGPEQMTIALGLERHCGCSFGHGGRALLVSGRKRQRPGAEYRLPLLKVGHHDV